MTDDVLGTLRAAIATHPDGMPCGADVLGTAAEASLQGWGAAKPLILKDASATPAAEGIALAGVGATAPFHGMALDLLLSVDSTGITGITTLSASCASTTLADCWPTLADTSVGDLTLSEVHLTAASGQTHATFSGSLAWPDEASVISWLVGPSPVQFSGPIAYAGDVPLFELTSSTPGPDSIKQFWPSAGIPSLQLVATQTSPGRTYAGLTLTTTIGLGSSGPKVPISIDISSLSGLLEVDVDLTDLGTSAFISFATSMGFQPKDFLPKAGTFEPHSLPWDVQVGFVIAPSAPALVGTKINLTLGNGSGSTANQWTITSGLEVRDIAFSIWVPTPLNGASSLEVELSGVVALGASNPCDVEVIGSYGSEAQLFISFPPEGTEESAATNPIPLASIAAQLGLTLVDASHLKEGLAISELDMSVTSAPSIAFDAKLTGGTLQAGPIALALKEADISVAHDGSGTTFNLSVSAEIEESITVDGHWKRPGGLAINAKTACPVSLSTLARLFGAGQVALPAISLTGSGSIAYDDSKTFSGALSGTVADGDIQLGAAGIAIHSASGSSTAVLIAATLGDLQLTRYWSLPAFFSGLEVRSALLAFATSGVTSDFWKQIAIAAPENSNPGVTVLGKIGLPAGLDAILPAGSELDFTAAIDSASLQQSSFAAELRMPATRGAFSFTDIRLTAEPGKSLIKLNGSGRFGADAQGNGGGLLSIDTEVTFEPPVGVAQLQVTDWHGAFGQPNLTLELFEIGVIIDSDGFHLKADGTIDLQEGKDTIQLSFGFDLVDFEAPDGVLFDLQSSNTPLRLSTLVGKFVHLEPSISTLLAAFSFTRLELCASTVPFANNKYPAGFTADADMTLYGWELAVGISILADAFSANLSVNKPIEIAGILELTYWDPVAGSRNDAGPKILVDTRKVGTDQAWLSAHAAMRLLGLSDKVSIEATGQLLTFSTAISFFDAVGAELDCEIGSGPTFKGHTDLKVHPQLSVPALLIPGTSWVIVPPLVIDGCKIAATVDVTTSPQPSVVVGLDFVWRTYPFSVRASIDLGEAESVLSDLTGNVERWVAAHVDELFKTVIDSSDDWIGAIQHGLLTGVDDLRNAAAVLQLRMKQSAQTAIKYLAWITTDAYNAAVAVAHIFDVGLADFIDELKAAFADLSDEAIAGLMATFGEGAVASLFGLDLATAARIEAGPTPTLTESNWTALLSSSAGSIAGARTAQAPTGQLPHPGMPPTAREAANLGYTLVRKP